MNQIILPNDAPIIVNYGAGVDSTAMLVAMVKQGIKPDLIIFADPGGEKPETYRYIPYFSEWLVSQGFPSITWVAYKPARAKYHTLEGNCIVNETLPSISFRRKSCTLKFKAAVMDAFHLGISRGPNKKAGFPPVLESLKRGIKPVKLIGYDAGPIDSCRGIKIVEDKHFRYLYPLRMLGWSREECVDQIKAAGLAVPIKSACFYCAASKPWELYWLGAKHPELLGRALYMEDNALNGGKGLTTIKGLWAHKESWRTFCEREGIVAPDSYNIIADPKDLLAKAALTIPACESNLVFDAQFEPGGLKPTFTFPAPFTEGRDTENYACA